MQGEMNRRIWRNNVLTANSECADELGDYLLTTQN
jgi:hypothetical protein